MISFILYSLTLGKNKNAQCKQNKFHKATHHTGGETKRITTSKRQNG